MKSDSIIKAEEIDGYRGGEDLESLLQFIEPEAKDFKPVLSADEINKTGSSGSGNSNKKRSRRIDRKSKRSRTPSTTTQENKSPDPISQKTSRASSYARQQPEMIRQQPEMMMTSSLDPDVTSVTSVKNTLVPKKAAKNKPPKRQTGWLVDFNNDASNVQSSSSKKSGNISGQQPKLKTKPPKPEIRGEPPEMMKFGLSYAAVASSIAAAENRCGEDQETVSSEEPVSLEPDPELEQPEIQQSKKKLATAAVMDSQESHDVCFNYASILKFIKHGELITFCKKLIFLCTKFSLKKSCNGNFCCIKVILIFLNLFGKSRFLIK